MAKKTEKKVTQTNEEQVAKVSVKPEHKSLNEALFAFQGECPSIPRNGTGEFSGRTYKYATLDDVLSGVGRLLQKHGLMITQPMTGNMLITKIIHVSTGQELASELELGRPERTQDLGSRITYLRRYQIVSMLGITVDDDTDAKPSQVPVGKPSDGTGNVPQGELSSKVEGGRQNDVMSTIVTEGRSMPFQKANAAIDTCMSVDALAILKGNIEKSVKLDEMEKKELIMILEAKEHGLNR